LNAIDRRFRVLAIGSAALPDPDGAVARTYGADPGTVYLLRPDHHIAGRWKQPVAAEIEAAVRAGFGKSTP
jgi:3-(3-hydroxy-phenyl)propionate hydroxylase